MPRRRLKGKVISDKMEKTVVVAVERVFAHPVYKKQVKVTRRFMTHDESGAKVGDEVVIEETRPLSKEKRWRVAEVNGKPVTKKMEKEEPKEVAKPKKHPPSPKASEGKKRTRK